MTWEQLKQYLFARLHRPTEQTLWHYPLGRIQLSTVSNWVDTSDVVTEIPYSLSDTPIFQDFNKEDYIYYGSIPNMY
jgi:hypothetical protein